MEFEWSTNDIAKKTVTIYSTNLTLNKAPVGTLKK